jgi:MSHA type pilus biogenesis protein MshL
MPWYRPARLPTARLAAAAAALLLSLGGCASAGGAGAAPVSVRGGPAPESAAGAAPAPLPALEMTPARAAAAAEEPRIRQLDAVDLELVLVLRTLAERFGLGLQIDPGVSGAVTTRLRDATLEQALDALVLQRGYGYRLEDGVLRVMQSPMETRFFTLDYVSISRIGVGTTVVQRSLSGTRDGARDALGGLGGGYGPPAGSGADVIQSVSVADLWEGIRVSLEGLVFAGAPRVAPAGAPSDSGAFDGPAPIGPAPEAPDGGRAPASSSRVAPDGRRLIINPLSGTIAVRAPRETLDEVDAFLRTVEASVQRQVLIEAKIVEVSLNRSYEFGIDWSVVRRVGNVNLQLGAGTGGAHFTLDNHGDADGTVSLVLHALQEQGKVSVLSSPRVAVLNNQRATFDVTTDEVFFGVTRQPILGPTGGTIGFTTEIEPQQVAVGITLDVLPQIAADNTITMSVRPVVTDVVAEKKVVLEDGSQASAPVIDRRQADTMVRARAGETIVIGGLMQSRERSSRSGVPILGDIPGLGRLFGGSASSNEKRELVIFITPRIVAAQRVAGG